MVAQELARLRKLIYEQLGYRDFNAFLHHYRIREACEMLGDPDRSRIPIFTIALCRFCVVTRGG